MDASLQSLPLSPHGDFPCFCVFVSFLLLIRTVVNRCRAHSNLVWPHLKLIEWIHFPILYFQIKYSEVIGGHEILKDTTQPNPRVFYPTTWIKALNLYLVSWVLGSTLFFIWKLIFQKLQPASRLRAFAFSLWIQISLLSLCYWPIFDSGKHNVQDDVYNYLWA